MTGEDTERVRSAKNKNNVVFGLQYKLHLCKRTQMAGLMIDYGFAPQHPFPVGLNEVIKLISRLDLPSHAACPSPLDCTSPLTRARSRRVTLATLSRSSMTASFSMSVGLLPLLMSEPIDSTLGFTCARSRIKSD